MKVRLHLQGAIDFDVPEQIAAIGDPITRNDAIDEWLHDDINGPIVTTSAEDWAEAVDIEETEFIND